MIQIPQNDLSKRLENIQDPKEHDEALSIAWKSLVGTPAKDALDWTLAQLEGRLVSNLVDQRLTSESRAFSSGQLNMIYTLQATIDKALNFDPESAEYDDPEDFGDPDDLPNTELY